MGFVIQISKTGDVKTANPIDLILNSNKANLKGYLRGTGLISVNAGNTGVVTVNHDLGYIPFCEAFLNDTLSNYFIPSPFSASGPSGILKVKHYFNASDLKVVIENGTSNNLIFNYLFNIYNDKGKL